MNKLHNKSGFTLIEVIAVLVIVGILATVLGNSIIYAVQNLIFARDANQLSQKAQLALARINKELTDVSAVSAATATKIDYTLSTGDQYSLVRDSANNQITLAKTSSPTVGAKILIDSLAAYGSANFLTYQQVDGTSWDQTMSLNQLAQIRVLISLSGVGQGAQPLTFQTSVNPRRSQISNAPRL